MPADPFQQILSRISWRPVTPVRSSRSATALTGASAGVVSGPDSAVGEMTRSRAARLRSDGSLAKRLGLLMLITLLALAHPAAAGDPRISPGATPQPPNGLEKVADLVILRPLGLAATALGAAIFVVTLPFIERESGSLDRAVHTRELFIDRPVDFTFNRPLGYWNRNE